MLTTSDFWTDLSAAIVHLASVTRGLAASQKARCTEITTKAAARGFTLGQEDNEILRILEDFTKAAQTNKA